MHTATALRQAAEARLQARTANRPPQSEAELRLAQHELEVHQIELEIQNEALQAAQAELANEHNLLRTLIDHLPDMVYARDATNRFLVANQTFARRMGGFSQADLIGKTDADFYPPKVAACFAANDRKVLAGGAMLAHECSVVFPDGERLSIVSTKVAFRNAQGEVTGLVGVIHDITEQKKLEARMREAQAVYQSLVSQLPVAIFRKDAAGRYVVVNPQYCRLKGMKPEDFLGKTPLEIQRGGEVTPQDEGLVFKYDGAGEQHHQQIMQTGEPIEMEEEYLLADGRRHFLQALKFPVLDAEGKVIGSQGVLFDITQRKRAELEMSFQHRLSQVLLGLPSLADHSEETAFIQQALEQTEELTGSRISFAHFVHADENSVELVTWSRRTLEHYCRAAFTRHYPVSQAGIWADAVRQRKPVCINDYAAYPGKHGLPEGHSELTRMVSVPVLEHDKVVMLLGIGNKTEDYTERDANAVQHVANLIWRLLQRRREAASRTRLATAIEQAAEAVVITNTKGDIIYANPAFEKTTGYTLSEALGQNARLLKSGKQDDDFYRQLWATLQRGEVWTGHFTNKRKDGTLFEEEATISPIRAEDGTIVSYVAAKRDVTREMQLESQIRQAQKMEAIGTLAGGIAHDFNNMLGAMFGYAHLLQQDTVDNPMAQESVAEILKAATRAKELVQQILTFSRRRESSRQVVGLDSTIREAAKFLRASLPAQITIQTQFAPDAPAVLADPSQIYQVTMNLATNALHAMEGRAGQLTLALASFQPDETFLRIHPRFTPIQYARLTVADTGSGMDARTLDRIFEPFFTTKPIGKGTGLGLSVVHGIVESHHGIITVESHPGQGTTFNLYFPAEASAATLAADPAIAAVAAPLGRGQDILVLDDEVALAAMIQKYLRRLHYQVTTSNHPVEAIRLFRENPARFQLVITDLTMPEMNGLEVARQLRALRPELPVILVSGLGLTVEDERLRAAGICERLDKPVSLEALAEMVERVLTSQVNTSATFTSPALLS